MFRNRESFNTGELLMFRFMITLLLVGAQGAMCQATFHGNVARTGVYDSPGPTKLMA